MSDRFFASHPIAGDHLTLDGPEAHHLLHVMRAVAGTEVTLFDNSAAEFDARRRIDSPLRSHTPRDRSGARSTRELPFTLEVGFALPKGDRQQWLVEKLAELGVTTLVPLTTEAQRRQPTATLPQNASLAPSSRPRNNAAAPA